MNNDVQNLTRYLEKYSGSTFVIVGKGPTRFQYENLYEVSDPIIFINDAVQFSCFGTAAPEQFFFAQDSHQAAWLTSDMLAVAVIPHSRSSSSSGKEMLSLEWFMQKATERPEKIVTYEWDKTWRSKPDDLGCQTRKAVAERGTLFLAKGTIHSAVHFAWLCGAEKIVFIGCDGYFNSQDNAKAYDSRIRLIKGSQSKGVHSWIRRMQDWMCDRLGMTTEYVNEPGLRYVFDPVAHFAWAGGPIPSWAVRNIEQFRKTNPAWRIKVWTEVPGDAPDWLKVAYNKAELRCQQADLLRALAVYRYGGIYLDADVWTLRSLDPLRRFEFFAGQQRDGRINNAVFGGHGRSDGLDKIIDAIGERARRPPFNRTSFGPSIFTKLFHDHYEACSILPPHYFYPLPGGKSTAAADFREASSTNKVHMLTAACRSEQTDQTPPYTVHLWGVEDSSHAEVKPEGYLHDETEGVQVAEGLCAYCKGTGAIRQKGKKKPVLCKFCHGSGLVNG